MSLTRDDAGVDVVPSPAGGTLVIGCGNLLRGDDAVGPTAVRRLWDRWGSTLPPGVRCADGGTAGMDVAFQMRGVDQVILVDACTTGGEVGSLYEVPGEELEELPPPDGQNLHSFRWEHALAFARWLLKEDAPRSVVVYLVEAVSFGFGEDLSPLVDEAVDRLVDKLYRDLTPSDRVVVTDDGQLVIGAEAARRWFPDEALAVELVRPPGRNGAGELRLSPRPRAGRDTERLLVRFGPGGDYGLSVVETLPAGTAPGPRFAVWDDTLGAVRVGL